MLMFDFFVFVGIRQGACTIVQTDGKRRIRVRVIVQVMMIYIIYRTHV